MPSDDTGMLPADAIRPGRVITGEGPGYITEEHGQMLTVQVDHEERPFLLERRQVQVPTPWLVLQIVRGSMIEVGDDTWLCSSLCNAFFVEDSDREVWSQRTFAENEIDYTLDILGGSVKVNHEPLCFANSPIRRFACSLNYFGPGTLSCHPSEVRQEVLDHYLQQMSQFVGTTGHIHLGTVFEGENLMALTIATCCRKVVSCTYGPNGPEPI